MDKKEQIIDNMHRLVYGYVRKAKDIKYPDPDVEKHIERHLIDDFGEEAENLHKQFHKKYPHLRY